MHHWNALRLWINEQEDAELRTGRPAPLTAAQRGAIEVLVPGALRESSAPGPKSPASASPASPRPAPAPAPAPAPNGVVVDPNFDQVRNWVSSLNEYTQIKAYAPPEFEFIQRELAPRTPVKWEGICTVRSMGISFPSAEYGFLGGQAPWFSTKKEAKQYVSMCAMRYISDLASPNSRFQASTTPAQQSTPAETLAEATNGVPISHAASSVPTSSDSDSVVSWSGRKKARLGSNGGVAEDEPDVSAQIALVCKRLGLTIPWIEAAPHDEIYDYFDARPVFPDSFPAAVPADLGVVTGVLTKRAAKEASALKVLGWLRELERERDGDLAGLLSQRRL